MRAHARSLPRPRWALALLVALVAALALSPAPALASGQVGTYAEGSAGFFRWLGDEEAARVAEGQGVTGSASTKYLGSALATRELASSPFNLDSMRVSIEILRACNECRAQEGRPALMVDTLLMAYSQVATTWSSHYLSDSAVTSDPHASFKEFGAQQGKANGENIAWNYSDVDTAFWQWYTDEKEEYLAGNVEEAGHYLNIINPSFTHFGAAYSKKAPSLYNTYEQTFGTHARGMSLSVEEFAAKFEEYYALVTQGEPPATSHDVTLVQPEHGRLIEYSNSHDVGAWVVVYVEPDEGYEIASINVSGVEGVTISQDGENPRYKAAQFYMPNNDVTVSAELVPVSPAETFEVSCQASGHGAIYASHAEAGEGDTVTVSLRPDEGYELESVVAVNLETGAAVSLAGTGGTRTFVMPAANVRVTATFAEVPEETGPFTDVPSNAWYADEVARANELGYLTGYAGTTEFGPEDRLTRAQAAVVLFNMANSGAAGTGGIAPDGRYNASATLATGFADVDGDTGYAWASAEIRWARDMGLVVGTGSGFEPGRSISREEFATMLARYAQRTGRYAAPSDPDATLSRYTDSHTVDAWFRDSVAWAVEAGVMGQSTTALNSDGSIIRAEVATMAIRLQP